MKTLFEFSFRFVISVAAFFLAAYPLILRRWHSMWGTTRDERQRVYPGDMLVALPRVQYTRAITIAATPAKIFPWLLQIGQGRGGFYSYELLENIVGSNIHNANGILPQYQNLKVGDIIRLIPRDVPSYRVGMILPDEALVLQTNNPANDNRTTGSWGFYLHESESGTTRLIIRSRLDYEPTVMNFIIWRLITEPVHFLMEEKMLRGIKERVEGTNMPVTLTAKPT